MRVKWYICVCLCVRPWGCSLCMLHQWKSQLNTQISAVVPSTLRGCWSTKCKTKSACSKLLTDSDGVRIKNTIKRHQKEEFMTHKWSHNAALLCWPALRKAAVITSHPFTVISEHTDGYWLNLSSGDRCPNCVCVFEHWKEMQEMVTMTMQGATFMGKHGWNLSEWIKGWISRTNKQLTFKDIQLV